MCRLDLLSDFYLCQEYFHALPECNVDPTHDHPHCHVNSQSTHGPLRSALPDSTCQDHHDQQYSFPSRMENLLVAMLSLCGSHRDILNMNFSIWLIFLQAMPAVNIFGPQDQYCVSFFFSARKFRGRSVLCLMMATRNSWGW